MAATLATLASPALSEPPRRTVDASDGPPPASLDRLRGLARAALLAPALDLDRPCALIPWAGATADEAGALLLRALDRASARPMTFHPPGCRCASFAESWLLSLMAALRGGDDASAQFLVGRVVTRPHRRAVLFLAQRCIEAEGAVADAKSR